MESKKLQKMSLPNSPGVYFFLGRKAKILYIGKATSLKSRVRSYFSGDIGEKRSPLIQKMVEEAVSVRFQKTDSVLEALILEAMLIKKHLPLYNTDEKDNKSFNYVVITHEEYPRVLVVRGRELPLKFEARDIKYQFGPFPMGGIFKEAMKLIRKIFPFRDTCVPNSGKPCFNYQLGLCAGTCVGAISAKDYGRHIRHLVLFFEGKKSALLTSLKSDMRQYAKNKEFEKAEKVKRELFGITHIQDVALIKDDLRATTQSTFRIEAYDVAHMSGQGMTGVMTVVEDGEAKKSEYRKFKIRDIEGANDTAALAQILERRLSHDEWPLPRLIVVDGSTAQRNVASKVLTKHGVVIPIVSVVKDEHHRPRGIEGDRELVQLHEKEILLGNSEAHRFAIAYHKNLRNKAFFGK